MPREKIDKKDEIVDKLEYLGLDLQNIPNDIKKFESLGFRVPRFHDEKQYRQYRYVPIKDIQILLSPTNRLDDLEMKYKKARPLAEYLDDQSEENIVKHTTFLNMLKQIKVDEIEKIEKEQKNLNKKIPFKVKFEGNYLWQIYYSENTQKYFMIVPTEDSDYSTFFYLLKKKLEKKRTSKIFVPIRNVGYSNEYLKKSEFDDLENYLWLFTKDWPLIYEVYDKSGELSIQIIGETQVYEKIKSLYKIKIDNKEEAKNFYKLVKALFILQTELPSYFSFKTFINKYGFIEFYYEDEQIKYENIAQWINDEYIIGLEKINVAQELIEENKDKLQKIKVEVVGQEIEYLAKEKQISTFLECKKSFFGKFKYYFKYSKKSSKKVQNKNAETELKQETQEQEVSKRKKKPINRNVKENYTIEELIELYNEYQSLENELRNLVMDINALKLKNKNTKKKIENATLFIREIDEHKKSIFEFWKYSNKDEVTALTEGEEEEVNIIKKITRAFDYESDFENFGKMMDKMQRKNLTKEEKDSIYITTTNLIDILNKVKNGKILPKEIENSLKELKKESIEEKTLTNDEEFDIFGGIAQDKTKVSKIGNKNHREMHKDKFNILDINKNTKQTNYKLSLEKIIESIESALKKVVITENLPVYQAINDEKLDEKKINIFNINSENEIKQSIMSDSNKINFYKINLKKGINIISYTNCIFYDNQNKTLPIGQDLSTKILIDISKLDLKIKTRNTCKILRVEDEKDDFSAVSVKTINIFEYEI